MKKINFFLTLLLFLTFVSCSKEEKVQSKITEKSLNLQVLKAYEDGLSSLKKGDVLYAAQKFHEAEILFPQSEWAPKSSLMAAYAYYSQDYYSDTIRELNRFIKIYPKDVNLDYAYYLLAITYYEQIVDEKKDIQSIINAKETFDFLIKKFPNTEYALSLIHISEPTRPY